MAWLPFRAAVLMRETLYALTGKGRASEGVMSSRFLFIFLAVAFALGLPRLASAQVGSVDCKHLGFSFAQASDSVSVQCYRERYSESSSGTGSGDISWTVETMFVFAWDRVVRITNGKAGSHAYFEKRPVQTVMRGFDELKNLGEWESEPDFHHYRIVRFHAMAWYYDSECFGFVKYGAPRITQYTGARGVGSFMEGYGCWRKATPDRATIEGLLDAIK